MSKHNWEFINEVEDWIHIPENNLAWKGVPRGILEAQLTKAIELLQEAKDRLVKLERDCTL